MAVASKNYSWNHTVTIPGSSYDVIFDKLSKLSSEINGKISLIEVEEGKKRYHHFVDNGHKWLKDDYEHEGFQAVYCDKLFLTRAEMICYVLSAYDVQCPLPNLFCDLTTETLKARTLRVASFGCGPGCDLVGFEAFYSNLKEHYIQLLKASKTSDTLNTCHYSEELKCIEQAKIDFIGYDSARGWSRYLDVLGYSYKHQVIDYQFVTKMEPVDIVILSYFAHNANFSTPVDPPRLITMNGHVDSVRNWDILKEKSKLIIVLDTKICKNQLFSLLTMRGFCTILELHDSKGREMSAHVWSSTDLWA